MTPRLILASSSPRRRQLLEQAGFTYEVIPTNVPEDFPADMPFWDVPAMLASRKAAHLAHLHPEAIILAADTVVVLEGEILNKPEDADDARRMLRGLSGITHTVLTGVCLRRGNDVHTFTERSLVNVRKLSDQGIDHYIEHYRPYDRAGAYGIQDWLGLRYITGIDGCFYNVMGLPVPAITEKLEALGWLSAEGNLQ